MKLLTMGTRKLKKFPRNLAAVLRQLFENLFMKPYVHRGRVVFIYRLLSISTSFNRSTIDFFQSSFSEFFAARPSRIAVTSTVSTGAAAASGVAAGAGVAGETADAAGVVPEGAVADSIVVPEDAGTAGAAAPACPNILDIRLLNIPIGMSVRFIPAGWMYPESSDIVSS
jgi:hypothetical protein